MFERYYKILGVEPGAPPDRVKEAYYQAAKKNHPDLFPEEERHSRQLNMMRINEAYLCIVTQNSNFRPGRRGDNDAGTRSAATGKISRRPRGEEKNLSHLRDPAYTYYKLGFTYYTRGRKAFFDRYKPRENRFHYMMDNREILLLAISCLKLFEKSYTYFSRVVEDHPDSIWYKDTVTKMYYLERYNAIYHRICTSIAAQIEAKQSGNRMDEY